MIIKLRFAFILLFSFFIFQGNNLFGQNASGIPYSFSYYTGGVIPATTTGTSGTNTLTVSSNAGLVVGMSVTGAGIASNAVITAIAGTTITLSLNNSDAVPGPVTVGVSPFPGGIPRGSTTGFLGASTVTVTSNLGLVVGMSVTGAGIGASAVITNIVNTTITLSVPNTAAVSGTITFGGIPLGATTGASAANTVTVTSNTGLIVGMTVTGGGIGFGAVITAITGTTITLSVANSGIVNGTITFGGVTSFAVPPVNQDNSMYNIPATNLSGFSFPFAGVNYTGVSVSTNGFLVLNNGAVPAYYSATALPTNSLSGNAGGNPIIAPVWDDLLTAFISHIWVSPNLFVRWNSKWDKSTAVTTITGLSGVNTITVGSNAGIIIGMTVTGTGIPGNTTVTGIAGTTITISNNTTLIPSGNGTFSAAANPFCWVKLDCSTGKISFSYSGAAYTVINNSGGASMGIAGICAGDYYSVTPTLSSATSDSSAENSTIAVKPVSLCYEFKPVSWTDNCSSALDLGTVPSSCSFTSLSNLSATTSGSAICSTSDVKDVWVKYTKPASMSAVKFTTGPTSCFSALGTSIEVFTSCGGTSLGCTTSGTTYPAFGELTVARPCTSEVLYVRITVDADAFAKFQICASDGGSYISPSSGASCSNSTFICSLPYSQTGLTTAGYGNDYDSLNAACHDPFMNGEDYVFSYTPTSPICISLSFTSSGSNPGLFVLDGCPNVVGTNCISSAYPSISSPTVAINSISLAAGQTYYFVVDNNPLSGTSSINFDISITQSGSAPANDLCVNATNLGTIPNNQGCTYSTYTTECSTPSPTTGYPAPTCTSFSNGVTGDVWLKFTAGFTGNLLITTLPSSGTPLSDAGMAFYTGTCGSFSLLYCDDNSAGNSMPLLSVPVSNGVTYYIRVWTVSPASNGQFDLCISSACAPSNDLPCSAALISAGGTVSGSNVCAGTNNEPANSAQCVAGGTINTVWFKVVVPTSGQIRVRTNTQTLTDTQIQAFTFPTGCANAASSFVSRGCNDDGADCGTQNGQSYHDYSDLTVTGLTPNDTLFIAVDGFGSSTGTFLVTASDATAPLPPIYLQDCDLPNEVCGNSTITIGDPGALNFGNICDFSTNYDCWQNPERNSNWYHFTVNPGTLQFTVNSPGDYDWIMWDITGVSNACALIQTHGIPTVRCNWVTTTGQTGLSSTNTGGAWGSAVTVSGTPHEYLLLIDNWNPPFQVTGYNLNWNGSPIASSPTAVTWQGSVDTMFSTTNNWGNVPCNANPSCSIDATVAITLNGRQPTINASTSVKNLTINSGATLRIKTGTTLSICGNMTVNGNLIAEPGSTIQFIGSSNATITGTLTGTNGYANLIINKIATSTPISATVQTTTISGSGGSTSVTVGSATGLAVGMSIIGNGIANGATISAIAGTVLTMTLSNSANVSGTGTFTGNIITVGSAASLTVGQTVTGSGIAPGTTITAIVGTTVTLSKNLYGAISGSGLFGGSVTLQNNIDVKENFTVASAISVFNINSKYLKVAGNFTNNTGNLTFTGYPSSTVEFNGTLNQFFTNTNGALTLYNVKMNKTGATKLYLTGTNSSLIIDSLGGVLNMTSGNIVTPVTAGSQEVNIKSNVSASIINHNASSFVDGKIRRRIYANNPLTLPLILDFPVGDSLTPGGYNLAVLTYNSGTVIPDVLVWFNPWASSPPPNGPASSECVLADYSTQQLLNNGYWTFSKASASFNGQYSLSLRNYGFTNQGTNIGFTIVKADILANPMLQASWGLVGTCVTTSTLGNTQRVAMNSPATSTTSLNHFYTTGQFATPLPIELLYFNSEPSGDHIVCKWETASEINNDHFEVQRSADGDQFIKVGQVHGFGEGTTTVHHNYQFVDSNACNRIYYYRLKQVDIDNNYSLSQTVVVKCGLQKRDIDIYPNPAGSTIICGFNAEGAGPVRIQILDLLGNVVKDELFTISKGYNAITSDISALPSGVYSIKLKESGNANDWKINRFVKN